MVVLGQSRAVLVILGQYGVVLAGTWWYLVSIRQYWLVLGGNGTVGGGTGWYLVAMGQYGLV